MLNLSTFTDPVKDLAGMQQLESDEAEADDTIEFVTEKELYGAIPEPIPASKVLPDWYKQLGQRTTENDKRELQSATVKRCMPFLDAMTMGWILPLAAEVQFDAEDGYVQYTWGFDEDVVSSHNMNQVGGDMFPENDWPILKFHNFWCINVPDGYSLLVTNPLNRIEPRFQTFSGVVDADHYFNYINAPFMWTGGEYHGVMDAGTPIVQVIPFKRDAMLSDGVVREMTEDEHLEQRRTQTRLNSQESMYRDERWQAKRGSRNVPPRN